MSNSNQRDYINFRKGLPMDEKRRLVGPAKQITPWYSPHRTSTAFVVACLLAGIVFRKPISDIFTSTKNAFRLYRAQEQFKLELDAEEQQELPTK